MKVLLDAMGGDNAPEEIILGAARALEHNKDLTLVIVGDKDKVTPLFSKYKMPSSRVEFIPSTEVVLNTDHPASFLREKPNSSLALGFTALGKREDISALVTAGPTGAVLTGSIFKIGRIPGVKRPALMATFPTRKEKVLCRLLDAGANMDCKSEYLLQFALMADSYLKAIGIDNPRVGLLNVGAEEGKGNELAKATYPLLKKSGLNFVGNIEADHILKAEADVVVCDGFWGNVYCKAIEDTAYWMSDLFKGALFHSFWTKLGCAFQFRQLKKVKEPISYANKACAPMLGVKKLVLKCHGKAKADSIELTIEEAMSLARNNLIGKITEVIAKQNAKLEEAAAPEAK